MKKEFSYFLLGRWCLDGFLDVCGLFSCDLRGLFVFVAMVLLIVGFLCCGWLVLLDLTVVLVAVVVASWLCIYSDVSFMNMYLSGLYNKFLILLSNIAT